MALRSRPTSQVPAQVAGTLARDAGIDLAMGLGDDPGKVENRTSGLSTLIGYLVGLGIGTVSGIIRPHLGNISKPAAVAAIGATAMAAGDAPSISSA